MAEISTNSGKINVSAGQNTVNVGITKDYSQYYSQLSKDWATKTNGLVNNEDYSSKYYAEKSKDWATNSENNLNSVISQHEQITSEITQAREDISTDLSGALLDIESNKTNSITEINTARDKAQTDITNLKNSSVEEIKAEGAGQIAKIKQTGFYMQDGKLYYIDANGETKEFKSGSGLEVCDIGVSLFVDETKGLRRRLNGQIVDINTNTQGFLTRLKQITTLYPSLLCTEEEWQAIKSASKLGQCGKFVFNYSGVEIVSVRIPAVVNINGLADMAKAGLIKDESLPNINGDMKVFIDQGVGDSSSVDAHGALYSGESVGTGITMRANNHEGHRIAFDASRSSSTYKDNAPVQQEAIQYPYFIQIATGQETENNIINDIELNNPSVLFDNKYVEAPLYNLSWLKSDGEYKPKTTYIKPYEALIVEQNTGVEVGTTVDLPSGTKYTKRGLSVKLSTATDITDYDFVINTTDETFRLPLKNHSANDGNANLIFYYYVGETVQNANLIDAGRIVENIPNMANRNLSNLSDFGKIMCAKNAFAQIHYDPNDFSKIGAYWAVQNLTSGSVNIPAGGLWLTFVYKYNANTNAELIGSAFEVGIVLGGTKFEVTGSYPHYYFHGIRIQEA